MRGAKVRVYYGILLLAVTLWWAAAQELKDSNSTPSIPKRNPHTKFIARPNDGKSKDSSTDSDFMVDDSSQIAEELRRRVNVANKLDNVARGGVNSKKSDNDERNKEDFSVIKSFAERTSLQDGDDKIPDKSFDNRIVDKGFDRDNDDGKPKSYQNRQSNKPEESRNNDGRISNVESIPEIPLAIRDQNVTDEKLTKDKSDKTKISTSIEKSNSTPAEKFAFSSRNVDFSSTEPMPAESKVVREFSSRRVEQNVPFVTTTRGSNVVMTTSRSTRVEEVTVYDAEEEDEASSEEIKEKKKKPTGTSKEPKDHTTLRTGKILAGQKPYDGLAGFAGQLSAGTNRKSAFQSHAEYNPLERYPNSGGGVYRKPVTGYYDTGISNSGGRKPSPFDVRKPLYSLDSTYGSGLSGLQRRPSSSYPNDATTPYIRGRPGQDFSIGSAGQNPFLTGGVNSIPSLSTLAVTSSSKRPFMGSSGLTEGLSAFADPGSSLISRPELAIRIRKPSSPLSGEPFSRPSSLSRPELEGGFKPLLSSNYNELPSQLSQQVLQQQVYKQRVKPVRGPQGDSAQGVNAPSVPGAFNFNNIGLNMLYKETNVLNNQDFTSSGANTGGGGERAEGVSSSPSPSLLTLAGDSNLLDSSGTTVSEDQGGSEVSGGLVKKITRTRVKQGTLVDETEGADKPNVADDSEDMTTTETNPTSSNPSQTKYKLRKPALLTNITRKGVESNAIPQEVTSRKPVVKNNLKSRLNPTRTKVPSTTSPVTTTVESATTELDEEMEITTQSSLDSDSKANALKPIIGFNQRKRPPGKHSSPSSEISTTLPPVKVSSNTRLRKPTQAAFTTELPSTATPVKKIKPFVNWASRLQKVTTTEEDTSEEVTTLPDEEPGSNQGGAVTPESFTSTLSYASTSSSNGAVTSTSEHPYIGLTPGQDARPASQSTWTTQSTTPSVSKEDIVTTTAKLFENTIPSNKIGLEEQENNRYNKLPTSDESKKDDSRFTVKDFISKFNEDSSDNHGDSLEHVGPLEHSIANENDTFSSEPPLKSSSDVTLTSTTAATSPSPPVDLTTQPNHITTQQATLPNQFDLITERTSTELKHSTWKETTETNPTETAVESKDKTSEIGDTSEIIPTVKSIPNPTGPVEKPVASADPSYYDTPLDNVDMSEDMSGGGKVGDLMKPSSDRTKSNTEHVTHSENPIEETTRVTDISATIDRELAASSTVGVDAKLKTNEKIGTRYKETQSSGEVLDVFGILNATSTTTDRIHSSERNPTKENPNKVEKDRSEPSSTEHETHEVTQDTNSVSQSSTSEEEGTKNRAPVIDLTTQHTTRHSTTKAQSTSKLETSDPWRTDFSDNFWSNFESTTENWKPSPNQASKTTPATPWADEAPFSTVEKEIGSKEIDTKVIGSKDIDENFNTVLSSVSVTPPTEGTTATSKQSTKKLTLKTTPSPSTGKQDVTMTTHKQDVSVSMETNKQSPVTMPTSKQPTTSTKQTVLPPRGNVPTSSEGDFYSVEVMDNVGSPPIVLPSRPPTIEDPKHYIQLAIHSTPADICASLPAIGRAIIHLFQMGSQRVQSTDQMRVKNRDLLCTSPETQESQIFVEFYLTDGMGQFDRDINEEFLRLYSKQGGLETDLMITEAHLIGEEPIRDDVFLTDDNTVTPRPDTPPRVIAAIVIASVAVVCLVVILVLLFIMRKKGRSFNNRQRCIPVSLDDYSLDNVSVYNSTRRKSRVRASKRSYGNAAFDDPNIPSNPMAFAALANFARDRRAIEEEFATIPSVNVKPDELPPGVEDKNRYANVIPIPETRVRLCGPGENASPVDDYINANYVLGPKNEEKFYIACQAPLHNTIEDFWHMIWTHQSKVVLMITGLFENSVEKCADYLPPSEVLDCHRVFGDYQITLKRREVREKYVVSNLQIKNLETNLWRELTHVWYTSWPATGVPAEENSLIAFLIEARAHTKATGGSGGRDSLTPPIVIHCSPGTGRTGAVLACDLLIRQFETSRIVNVPTTVYNIRRCRAGLVATPQQYAFIYRVLNVYATKLTGGALDSF